MPLETQAWTGRGFSPKSGRLILYENRLRYEVAGTILFDAPVAELKLRWPWYGFGCQFWAHANGAKYFVSLMHTNNTMGTWWAGIQRGRLWKRALEEAGQ